MRKAFITGLAGTELTSEEAAFLKAEAPAGLILFSRNCRDHAQIKALVRDAKTAIGSEDVLVLIDQEGGRVQRLRPPLGRALPPGAAYGRLYETSPQRALDAAFRIAQLLAADLLDLGINTDCAPVLDVPVPGAHDIIGDRAYGSTPEKVAALGGAVASGFMAGGVLPVIKHIPGHGRAFADSHLELPVVSTSWDELSLTDFAAFQALADMPAAMTAHVVFTAIDAERPASTSKRVTEAVIRGEIGFDGFLMSDDLSMRALSGSLTERAEAVLGAGSDVALHCNGHLDEMKAVAAGTGALAGRALERFVRALAVLSRREPCDTAAAEAHLAALLGGSAGPESV